MISETAFLLELYSGTLMTHLGDSAHHGICCPQPSDQAQAQRLMYTREWETHSKLSGMLYRPCCDRNDTCAILLRWLCLQLSQRQERDILLRSNVFRNPCELMCIVRLKSSRIGQMQMTCRGLSCSVPVDVCALLSHHVACMATTMRRCAASSLMF